MIIYWRGDDLLDLIAVLEDVEKLLPGRPVAQLDDVSRHVDHSIFVLFVCLHKYIIVK